MAKDATTRSQGFMTVTVGAKQELDPRTPASAAAAGARAERHPRTQRPRRVGALSSETEIEAGQAEFEAALEAASAASKAPAKDLSLDAYMESFIMPNLSDPGILQASRSIPILERILSDLLPKLEGAAELHTLAAGVIEDEIARRRELIGRMQRAIGV
jgi:hypothetical protein